MPLDVPVPVGACDAVPLPVNVAVPVDDAVIVRVRLEVWDCEHGYAP